MTALAFRTVDGVVVPAITTSQMREVDRVAIEELGPNLYQTVENAGRKLAELAIELAIRLVEGESQNGTRTDSKKNGVAPGDHVRATITMTLALPKTGLESDAVGKLCLADIGIQGGPTSERKFLRHPGCFRGAIA